MSQASPCFGAANLQAWDSVRAGSAENEVKVRAVRAPGKLGGSTLLLLLWDPPGAWNSSPKGEVKRACLPAISRLGCTHLENEIYRESDLRSHGAPRTGPYSSRRLAGCSVRVSHGPKRAVGSRTIFFGKMGRAVTT